MRKSKFAIKQAKRKITNLIKSKQEDYKANKDIHHLPSHVFSNVNNLQYQFFLFFAIPNGSVLRTISQL